MRKKKISVIICSYNNAKYLEICLNSIFNQTESQRNYDVILIDDKSNDNSLKIAQKFKKNKNFFILNNIKNIGLVKSCNKAIKFSNSEFFVRVDSDDYVSKDFIKLFLNKIKKKYDFIYSNYKIVRKKNQKKININNFKKLISCSVAIKKSIFEKIGGYKEFMWEEYDLYYRYLALSQKIIKIENSIYFYRFHANNMTGRVKWKSTAWKQLRNVHNNIYTKEIENRFK